MFNTNEGKTLCCYSKKPYLYIGIDKALVMLNAADIVANHLLILYCPLAISSFYWCNCYQNGFRYNLTQRKDER